MHKFLKKITHKVYPFNMPGHKRNPLFLKDCPDITEISGADDLHHPDGIIKDSQEKAALLFRTLNTLYLTSGSTSAILSAISACTKSGDTILIGRNSHKSVYNAALINGLKTEYLMPEVCTELGVFGKVTKESVKAALIKTKATVVVITSPTYEGIVSDIKGIADTVHRFGGVLIVDSAHGAHLGFSNSFLPSARHLGADIVIESAHKTLPCLTGAALLHICSERVNADRVKTSYSRFQTSSPSYPILSSIDNAVSLISKRGKYLFANLYKNLEHLYSIKLSNLYLFRPDDVDLSKVLVVCKNTDITGYKLKEKLLLEYGIECEEAMPNFVLCLCSIADRKVGFKRLYRALSKIDKGLTENRNENFCFEGFLPVAKMSLKEASEAEQILVPLSKSCGKISGDFIYAYPPGSPIIAPGEVISKEVLEFIDKLKINGGSVYTSLGKSENINVIKSE